MALAGANPMLGGLALGQEKLDAEYSGWMMKTAPQGTDADKEASLGRTVRSIGNWARRAFRRRGDLQRRFFVLDGQDLRYFKDDSKAELAGTIELGTVHKIWRFSDALRSAESSGSKATMALRDDLPPHALLLETDARRFVLVPESDTAAANWEMRLSAVLRAFKRRGLVVKSLRHSHRPDAMHKGDASDDSDDDAGGGAAGGGGGGDMLFLLERRLDASHEAARAQPDGKAQQSEPRGWSREVAARLSAIAHGPGVGAETTRRRPSLVYAGRMPARASAQLSGNAGVGLLGNLDPAIDPDAGAIGGGTQSATAKKKAGSSKAGADDAEGTGGSGKPKSKSSSSSSSRGKGAAEGETRPARPGSEAWQHVYGHRPRMRQAMTRWEEISGNTPRSALSLTSAARLYHTGVMTPMVPPPDLGEEALPGGLFQLPGAPPVLGGHARPAVGRALEELKRRRKAEKRRLKAIKKGRQGRGGLDASDSGGANSAAARTVVAAADALKESLRELAQAPAWSAAASNGLEWSLEQFAGSFLLRPGVPDTLEQQATGTGSADAQADGEAGDPGAVAAARAVRRAVTARVASLGECLQPYHRWLEGDGVAGAGAGWERDPWLEGHVAQDVEATLALEEEARGAAEVSAGARAPGRGALSGTGVAQFAAWEVEDEEVWESELRAAAAAARVLASGGGQREAETAAAAARMAAPASSAASGAGTSRASRRGLGGGAASAATATSAAAAAAATAAVIACETGRVAAGGLSTEAEALRADWRALVMGHDFHSGAGPSPGGWVAGGGRGEAAGRPRAARRASEAIALSRRPATSAAVAAAKQGLGELVRPAEAAANAAAALSMTSRERAFVVSMRRQARFLRRLRAQLAVQAVGDAMVSWGAGPGPDTSASDATQGAAGLHVAGIAAAAALRRGARGRRGSLAARLGVGPSPSRVPPPAVALRTALAGSGHARSRESRVRAIRASAAAASAAAAAGTAAEDACDEDSSAEDEAHGDAAVGKGEAPESKAAEEAHGGWSASSVSVRPGGKGSVSRPEAGALTRLRLVPLLPAQIAEAAIGAARSSGGAGLAALKAEHAQHRAAAAAALAGAKGAASGAGRRPTGRGLSASLSASATSDSALAPKQTVSSLAAQRRRRGRSMSLALRSTGLLPAPAADSADATASSTGTAASCGSPPATSGAAGGATNHQSAVAAAAEAALAMEPDDSPCARLAARGAMTAPASTSLGTLRRALEAWGTGSSALIEQAARAEPATSAAGGVVGAGAGTTMAARAAAGAAGALWATATDEDAEGPAGGDRPPTAALGPAVVPSTLYGGGATVVASSSRRRTSAGVAGSRVDHAHSGRSQGSISSSKSLRLRTPSSPRAESTQSFSEAEGMTSPAGATDGNASAADSPGSAVRRLRTKRKSMRNLAVSVGSGYESASSAGNVSAAGRAGGPKGAAAMESASGGSDGGNSASPVPRKPLRRRKSIKRVAMPSGQSGAGEGSAGFFARTAGGPGFGSGADSTDAEGGGGGGGAATGMAAASARREARIRAILSQAADRVERREQRMEGARQGPMSSFSQAAKVPLAMGGGGVAADTRWGAVTGNRPSAAAVKTAITAVTEATIAAQSAVAGAASAGSGAAVPTDPSKPTRATPAILAAAHAWTGGVAPEAPPPPRPRVDPFSAAIRSLPLTTLPAGTLLLHPHPGPGRPPRLPPDTRLLRRDAAFILLRGRVRVISAPLREVDDAIAATLALPVAASDAEALARSGARSPVHSSAAAGGPSVARNRSGLDLLGGSGARAARSASAHKRSSLDTRSAALLAPASSSEPSRRRPSSASAGAGGAPPKAGGGGPLLMIGGAGTSGAQSSREIGVSAGVAGGRRRTATLAGRPESEPADPEPLTGAESTMLAYMDAEACGEEGDGPVVSGSGPGQETEWTELGATAAPTFFGISQLLRGAPPSSAVVAVTGVTLLVLSRPSLPVLRRISPRAPASLPYLEALSRPDRLVSCVPSLLAGVIDTSTQRVDGPSRAWQLAASLGALFRPVALPPGRTLYTKGDIGDSAYVILAGRVAISAAMPSAPGRWVLLDVLGPGRCLGESGLVVPAARSTRAVALSPCLLARVTHNSVRRALAHRPAVWRAVRSAVAWREPSQLIRVPLLLHLAGGEGHDNRIAPLCDCWTSVTLAHAHTRPLAPPPAVGMGPIGLDDVQSGLLAGPASSPEHRAAMRAATAAAGGAGASSADESVAGGAVGGSATARASLGRVPSHGPMPRAMGASRRIAALSSGMADSAAASVPILPPPLSCKSRRRTPPADTRAEHGYPEDVEEEEWRLAADEADDSAVRRAAALGAGAARVEQAAAGQAPEKTAAAVAAAQAEAEALAAAVPLVHAGPPPVSPLVGPLCERRIEGEAVHSLMLVVAGAASMHTRQEHAAAEAAVEAVRGGSSAAEAAVEAAEGIRGSGDGGTATMAQAALAGTGGAAARGSSASSAGSGRSPSKGGGKRRSGPTSTVLTKGDFFGGSTLLSKQYKLAARAEVTASARTAMAVVMLLPRATILRWCRLLPNYASKLAHWYEEGAGVDGGAIRRAMFDDMASNAAAASRTARASVNLIPATPATSGDQGKADADMVLDEWFFGAMDA